MSFFLHLDLFGPSKYDTELDELFHGKTWRGQVFAFLGWFQDHPDYTPRGKHFKFTDWILSFAFRGGQELTREQLVARLDALDKYELLYLKWQDQRVNAFLKSLGEAGQRLMAESLRNPRKVSEPSPFRELRTLKETSYYSLPSLSLPDLHRYLDGVNYRLLHYFRKDKPDEPEPQPPEPKKE
jgi:hypothetical protein